MASNHSAQPVGWRVRGFAALALCLLAGCGGPYVDLAKDFTAQGEPTGGRINVKRVVIVSQRHRGAYNYRGVLEVSLTANAVEIRPTFPQSVALDRLTLPAERVTGCSMTCFGSEDRRADLVFEQQGAEVTFDAAADIVDWCWRNGLPMLTGAQERAWLYESRPLPSKAAYLRVTRDEYERQAHNTCMGY